MRILVVEDDAAVLDVIVRALHDEGYHTDSARSGDEGWILADQGVYDLVLLDIMLPELDGISVVRRLRGEADHVPILLLTARDSVIDRVQGLDAGADDYLVKPFAVSELLARVRALLRRSGGLDADAGIHYKELSLRPSTHDAFVGDAPLRLTVKEYELLEFLIRNSERILTREQIFDRVWGFDADTGLHIVEVYIHYLRKKLAEFDYDRFVHNVRGVGYMLKEK